MLVAIGAVKGFGVTTLAVALAARWPKANAVVVEADPAGGDLAFRFGHHREPGLAELAADARRGGSGVDLAAYAQRLTAGRGRGVRVGGAGDAQAVSAVAALVDGGGLDVLRAAARERLVVVDVGRLDWRSPALPIACRGRRAAAGDPGRPGRRRRGPGPPGCPAGAAGRGARRCGWC